MLDLEGTKFLENFNTMYLRRNKLVSIPLYLLSNTLDKSPDGRSLFLEGNQLHCDCNSAKVLKVYRFYNSFDFFSSSSIPLSLSQLWLLSRQTHIPDTDRILCRNMNQKVLGLSEMKLCQSQHDWTDYIYYLIGAEILLLLALVMKVSYDYWVFKTAGYLPWPASKMPKLPCDWLCES